MKDRNKCPRCGQYFNDWFVFKGVKYCWPCYVKSGGQRDVIYDITDENYKEILSKSKRK